MYLYFLQQNGFIPKKSSEDIIYKILFSNWGHFWRWNIKDCKKELWGFDLCYKQFLYVAIKVKRGQKICTLVVEFIAPLSRMNYNTSKSALVQTALLKNYSKY